MGIDELQESVCLAAYCADDREDLKTAIKSLIDAAYTREIVPSLINLNFSTGNGWGNEWEVTLWGYPINHGLNHTINNEVSYKTSPKPGVGHCNFHITPPCPPLPSWHSS